MSFHVQLFAGLAELLGSRHVDIPQLPDATVGGLRAWMTLEFPDAATDLAQVLVAVNRAYAEDSTQIRVEDEIALIPPVGGGSDAPSCRILPTALSVADAYAWLEHADCGGIVLFCGTVREWTAGEQTSHLEYEAYTEMALAVMQRIEDEVQAQWPGVHTLQWHRVGHLNPTDIAVICGAASPHRDAAFAAARALIDRLKKEVPIWKKEAYHDGREVWQANP